MKSPPAGPAGLQPIPPTRASTSTAPSTAPPSPPPAPASAPPPFPPSTGCTTPLLSPAGSAAYHHLPAPRYRPRTPGPPTDCCTTRCPHPADQEPGRPITSG